MTGWSGLQPFLGALDELAHQTQAPASVYWSAIDAWIKARPNLRLVTVLITREERLVAAAFLAERTRLGILRCQKAGTAGEPFRLLAVDAVAAEQLAAGIVDHLNDSNRAWQLQLTDLPESDPTVAQLRQDLRRSAVHAGVKTPEMKFESLGINNYLSRNVRSVVAKAKNRVRREQHGLELTWSRNNEVITNVLQDVESVRDSRDRQLHRVHQHDEVELRTFVDTVTGHAQAEWVRLLEARIDGNLAAFAVCFLTARKLWVYANAVSPAYTRYSAGTIANAEVVRYAHARPEISILSWGAGIQRYKLSGPVEIVPSVILIASSSARTRLALRIVTLARRAMRGRAPGGTSCSCH